MSRRDWLLSIVPLGLWLALFGRYLWAADGVVPAERDGDFWLFVYPLADVAFEMLGRGTIPHWNPYTDCGVPLLISVQQGVLYPPNWIHLLVSTERAFCLLVVGHTLLAGVGTWLYCRGRECSVEACGVAAMVFIAGGTGLVHLHEGQLVIVFAIAWWPWILWQLDRLSRCRSAGGLAGLAALLALQFLVGFPIFTLVMAWLIPVYLLVFSVDWSERLSRGNRDRLAAAAGSAVLALGMVAAVLWPAVDFLDQAHRGELSLSLAESHSVPALHWLRAIVPGLFGDPVGETYWGDPQHWNVMFHSGAVGLVLAACGLFSRRRLEVIWWAVVAAGLISYCLGGVVFSICYLYLPGFSLFRRPMVLRFFLLFAVAVLAALGCDALRRDSNRRGSHWVLAATTSLGLAGLVYGIVGWIGLVDPPVWWRALVQTSVGAGELATRADLQVERFSELSGELIVVASAVLASGLVLGFARWRRQPDVGVAGLLGVVAIELFLLGSSWLESSTVKEKAAPSHRVAESLADRSGDFRLACLCDESSKLFNRFAIDRFQTPGGAEDLIPRRYSSFLFAISGQSPFLQHVFAFGPDTPRPVKRQFLDLLGVRYYVCPRGAHQSYAADLAGDRQVKQGVFSYRGVDYDLFENVTARQRVVIVHRWRKVESLESLEAAAASEQQLLVALEELLRPLIVEGFAGGTFVEVDLPQPGIPAGGSAPEDVSESVKLVERRAHRVTVQVKLARAGLVVFSDTWTPDWKATIDGRSETVVPANLFMRAVPCPAGEHTISVYYESESFGRGSIVSLGSLALCLALFLVGPLRRRISRPRSDPS
ncbi:MAG: hypothetical protein QF363_16130 [Planctomycetaceae bacterium]|jgi:hypothetical protein|nr:hypothetical protein [Planctomycetaceae bacterium]